VIKKSGVFILWIVFLGMVACNGVKSPPTDVTAPTVSSVNPLDGSSDIAINTTIVITFSEAMNQADSESAVSITPTIPCAFSWNTAGDVLTCDPANNLEISTPYTVTVGTSAKDLADNTLANPFSFSFTTGMKALETCKFNDANTPFNNCAFGS
jgi:hypothetical protein